MTFDFIDTSGESVAEIEGPADTIKRAAGALINVDEVKLHIDEDGIEATYVDAANVM